MSDQPGDAIEFDDVVAVGLAEAADAGDPGADVKARLMARVRASADAPPAGFSFRMAADEDWRPHPVPGIRMKVLALNQANDYATLLLDVAPGTRFPPHHHDGDEECYVISGSLIACGRRLGPGDFHHADAASDHGELYSPEGCRVLLVVKPEDYMLGDPGDPGSGHDS